jgi:hypothetical protein
MGDSLTMVVIVFTLGVIGFTIYSYLKQGRYSNYALAISIISCVGLVLLTRKTDTERQLAATSSVFGSLGSENKTRSLSWGGKKRK